MDLTLSFTENLIQRLVWITAALFVVTLVACGNGKSDVTSPFPVEIISQRAAADEQLYVTNCATCHGVAGETSTLLGAPSHAEDGHTWHHVERHLFEWILDGPPLAQVMPGFRGTLSDGEIYAVLAYIKSKLPENILTRQTEFSTLVEQQLIEDMGE
jgi:mono/diheme cytochrome c family protein